MTHQTKISEDAANKKLNVTREFSAPVEKVWTAWTTADTLDKWWAPKPWRAETKSLDFSEGGTWLYSMVGPQGERQFCRADIKNIDLQKSVIWVDNFCDADGNIVGDFPSAHWLIEFEPSGDGTLVKIALTFDTEADLRKLVDMGFNQGFTMAHGNLDEVLAG